MSYPPANFLKAVRRGGVDARWLMQIDLTDPSAKTLRFATEDMFTPDGVLWQGGFRADPITDAVDFLGPGPNLVTWQFTLANRTLSDGSARLDDLLSTYRFKGAAVTLYSWENSLASFADALPELVEMQIVDYAPNATEIVFTCSQSIAWNAIVPPKVVDTSNAPNATDAVLGLPYPIAVGDFRKPQMPSPFVNNSTEIIASDESGGGKLVVPFLLTDPGQGNADVIISAACHELSALFDQNNGYGVFVPGSGGLLSYFGTGGTTVTKAPGGSYISVDDGQSGAVAGVPPCAVNTGGAFVSFRNAATNPRAAMNPLDQTQSAILDQNAAKTPLCLLWPNASSLGSPGTTTLWVAFSGKTTNDGVHKLRVRLVDVAAGGVLATWTSTAGQLTSAGVTILTLSSPVYGRWDFAAAANANAVLIDFDGGTVNVANVYWVAYGVAYTPDSSIVIPERYGVRPTGKNGQPLTQTLFDTYGRPFVVGPGGIMAPEQPAVVKLETKIYGNVAGPVDDGGGTYTGTAGALIQKPPDVIRWLCAQFGGADPVADFESGAGAFGSFADLRTMLRGDWPSEFVVAVYLGQRGPLSDTIKNIASSCGFSVFLDRHDGKWRAVPWLPALASDYDLTFGWDIIDLVRAETIATVDVPYEFRLQWGFDYFSQRPLGEAYVGPDGSGTGMLSISKRDQAAIVVTTGVNDWIDYTLYSPLSFVTTNLSVQLSAATYNAPIDFAKAVQDALAAPTPSHPNPYVGWSFCVKASFNDALGVRTGGVNYTGTLTAGEMTGAARAADAQRALNASGFPGTFTVTYDQSTGLFTVACTAAFTLLNDTTPVAVAYPGWHVMGFVGPRQGASSYVADSARWYELFNFDAILSPATTSPLHGLSEEQIKLRFGTGAHAGTSAAGLLGFLSSDTAYASTLSSNATRNTREVAAVAARLNNGPKNPETWTADVIVDESTATRARNRRADMRTNDRVIVVFRTTWAPDLQRLRTIAFDSSLDGHVSFPRYGSDGSWAGKLFRVTKVTKYVADAQVHSEITAVEMR